MAKRQSTVKFYSTEVQGQGSHVIFRKPSYGDTVELRKRAYDIAASGNITSENPEISPEMVAAAEDFEREIWAFACDRFVDWDWVDEDDAPLPNLPDMDKADLLNEEAEFIGECARQLLFGDDEEKKRKPRRR